MLLIFRRKDKSGGGLTKAVLFFLNKVKHYSSLTRYSFYCFFALEKTYKPLKFRDKFTLDKNI